jgi:POT family proton-dependent oligopeptide transporter
MLVGLSVYLAGRRFLPRDTRKARLEADVRAQRPQITAREWATIAVLIAVLPILALCALGNMQIFNAYLVWGDAHYDLEFGGQRLPVTWLVSLDALVSTACLLVMLGFWRLWARWRTQPDEIVKLAIGAVIAAGAPLLLALGSANEAATGHKVSLAWGLGFHIVNDIGYANLFPVGLALFTRAAPRAVGGLMVGVYYLHLFIANLAVGYLGRFLEPMGPTAFWMLHAGLVFCGAMALVVFAIVFRRRLAPTSESDIA